MTRLIALGLALFALTACETAKGAGRDMKKVGDAVEDVAADIQRKF